MGNGVCIAGNARGYYVLYGSRGCVYLVPFIREKQTITLYI